MAKKKTRRGTGETSKTSGAKQTKGKQRRRASAKGKDATKSTSTKPGKSRKVGTQAAGKSRATKGKTAQKNAATKAGKRTRIESTGPTATTGTLFWTAKQRFGWIVTDDDEIVVVEHNLVEKLGHDAKEYNRVPVSFTAIRIGKLRDQYFATKVNLDKAVAAPVKAATILEVADVVGGEADGKIIDIGPPPCRGTLKDLKTKLLHEYKVPNTTFTAGRPCLSLKLGDEVKFVPGNPYVASIK